MIPDAMRFDPARIAAFAGGDAALAAELTALFLKNAEHYVAEYQAATDQDTRGRTLHKLKGAALTVGAGRLAALCLEGERGLEGGRAAVDQAPGLGETLAAELRALRSELGL